MRLPRELSGQRLARQLERHGYKIMRQTGSHMRLTSDMGTQHHVTIPAHDPLKIGTLSQILSDIGNYLGISRDELLRSLE